MSVMQLQALFVQFSKLHDSQREAFVRQHPELLSGGLVDWALMAGRYREPELRRRLAQAALFIATKLGDTQRQAWCQETLNKG